MDTYNNSTYFSPSLTKAGSLIQNLASLVCFHALALALAYMPMAWIGCKNSKNKICYK